MRLLLRAAAGYRTKDAFEAAFKALKDAGKLDNRLYDVDGKDQVPSSLKSLSMTDGNVKFAVRAPLSLVSMNFADLKP